MSFTRALSIIAAPLLCTASLLADPIVVGLWPGDAPGSEGLHGEEVWTERGEGIVDRAVANVDKPTMTVYLPLKGNNSGAAILVAPGGAYRHLAIDKEGHDVAKWLASIGIAGLVVKYRLPRTKGRSYSYDTALADAQRALRIARARAEEWGIDPKRLGMMGFSAGGHLAMLAGTKFDAGDPAAKDPIERQSSRPDFLAPIYPAAPKEMNITKETPPTFLVHANDDGLAAEKNSVRIYLGLKEAGVPAELHIYSGGGHGFGIRNRRIPTSSWPLRFEEWLVDRGFLTSK